MGRRKTGESDKAIKADMLERLGELFFRGGFRGITMDRIARDLRVSKKTLYRFFPSKEDMVLSVATLFTSRLRAYFERLLTEIEGGRPEDFAPLIERALSGIGDLILTLPVGMLESLESEFPRVSRKIEGIRRGIVMDCFTRIVEAGKRCGKVRSDLDPVLAAHVYAGMLNQIIDRRGMGPERSPRDVYSTVLSIMFRGIITRSAAEDFKDRPSLPSAADRQAKPRSRRLGKGPWEFLAGLNGSGRELPEG